MPYIPRVARLHEYQGKALLKQHGIMTPRGEVVRSADEARDAAERLGGRTILKVQAWITGRQAKGGVVLANSPDDAASAASKLLAMTFGNFPVTEVLIEELIDIAHEVFMSMSIDDALRAPVLLLDFEGGSGIEDRAATVKRLRIDPLTAHVSDGIESTLAASPIEQRLHGSIAQTINKLTAMARHYEARSLEINPLVVTRSGDLVAADCRMTIDDYAVFRHPELGIEIAREMDHPPTALERIAYRIEQNDHRGTFYFAQLPVDATTPNKGVIGFHGAGGGGSMMSMDAVTNAGFAIANFCDTSGNPSAAKVYRAARIILSQPGLWGYFGSGSGVASQEQFWSAYGLAKAFNELQLDVPAVIRLGGNSEDRAVDILTSACASLSGKVEGYKKDDAPAFCANRLAELVQQAHGRTWTPRARTLPPFVGTGYSFAITGGRVWIDHAACDHATTDFIVGHSSWLLKANERHKAVLAVTESEVANKDSEMIMLEIECLRAAKRVVFVDIPIDGIDT
jgi:succinyl-CoA synthetase beta subunit